MIVAVNAIYAIAYIALTATISLHFHFISAVHI